jgi:hypothetical protein
VRRLSAERVGKEAVNRLRVYTHGGIDMVKHRAVVAFHEETDASRAVPAEGQSMKGRALRARNDCRIAKQRDLIAKT